MRREVAELLTPTNRGLVQVTVSVGVTVTDPNYAPDLTRASPSCLPPRTFGLYRAKNKGRDQVQLLTHADRRR